MCVTTFARRVLCVIAALMLAPPAGAQITVPLIGETTLVSPIVAKLDPLLQARLSDLSGRSLVIVRAVDAQSVGAMRPLIEVNGGVPGRELPIIEALAADVPNTALGVLTSSPLVRRIALDRLIVGALDRSTETIGASAVRQQFGYDGSGIGVAVIDSGITAWHDDLISPDAPGSQRVDQFVDFVHEWETASDRYGHGTHVAGIIAGNGYDSGGGRTGIAPGARLTVLRVLDGVGRGRISNVIAALGYVLDHRARLNIRVANLSLGTGVYESYDTDFLTLAAKRVVDAGVVVVASAGNGGRNRDGYRQYGAITAPGNAPWVLTVGASSHMGTVYRGDDTVADFSSRGPTAIDRTAKPDVIAPGVGIVSLSNPDSYLFRTRSEALLPGTVDPGYLPYLSLSGTSQSAPVVAGTVALMLQAHPTLTPNAVKAILQYTAESQPEHDALTQGAGFVNARGAIELARLLATAPSYYSPAPEWSAQLIWGNRRVRSGRLTADANAWGGDVTWGASATPSGAAIVWGVIDKADGQTDAWGSPEVCADETCSTVVWRPDTTADSANVVWGDACGGGDCQDRPWSAADHTVVWGTGDDGETVVWGTWDGETDLWDTSDDEPVVWGEETAAGTSGRDDVSPPPAI